MDLNEISGKIIEASINVHSSLGPGLLESAYETCLKYELSEQGLDITSQVPIPIHYKEVQLEAGYRLDLLVEDSIIVELKSVNELEPIHEAQILSYLKLMDKNLGLLINFNVKKLKNGIRRKVLNL